MTADRKTAIEKLRQGRDFTAQLYSLLTAENDDGLSESAEDLVSKISNSFSDVILILNGDIDERKSDDSGESRRSSPVKDRRGCYKRRKGANSRTRITPTLLDDGHAWRKYGKKVILKAKFPRSYYRCTHKNEQGCQAKKQVQKTEDDPPMYAVTYDGYHTCKHNSLKTPHIIFNPTDEHGESSSSVLLNFESNIIDHKADGNPTPIIKRENLDHEIATPTTSNHDHYYNVPSLNYGLLPSEITPFGSLESCDNFLDDVIPENRFSDFMNCEMEFGIDEFMQLPYSY